MAFIKVVLLAVLAINLQGAYSDPGVKDLFGDLGKAINVLTAADKSRATVNEAVKIGTIPKQDGDIIIKQLYEAAMKGKLTMLQQVDISLNTGCDKDLISKSDKVKILVHAIDSSLHKKSVGSLEEARNAVIDAAVDGVIITPERAAQLKEVCPNSVEVDVNALASVSELHDSLNKRPQAQADWNWEGIHM